MHWILLKMHTTRNCCSARDYAAVSFTSEIDNLRIIGYFQSKCVQSIVFQEVKHLYLSPLKSNTHFPLLSNTGSKISLWLNVEFKFMNNLFLKIVWTWKRSIDGFYFVYRVSDSLKIRHSFQVNIGFCFVICIHVDFFFSIFRMVGSGQKHSSTLSSL